jgi:hypothetical protein
MGSVVIAGENEWFQYDTFLLGTAFVPPQIRPLVERANCANDLSTLGVFLWMYIGDEDGRKTRLACNEWCDALLQGNRPKTQDAIKKCWALHGEGERRCDLAMNSGWDVNSPADTVLLFETRPGWNQCGGSELFTFNNHDPKGGFVLLNDGTVKFIRTEKELKQLRWK